MTISQAIILTETRRTPAGIITRFALCAPGLAVIIAFLLTGAARAQGQLAVVSSASYSGAALASEEIAAAFGSGLTTSTAVATAKPLPTTLNNISVKVRDSQNNERLAPLFFVSPTQINFQIPPGTVNGAATVRVFNGSSVVASGTVQIASVAPGLFSADSSGRGLPAASVFRLKTGNIQSWESVAQWDAQQNRFVAVPVDLGADSDQLFLILYGTGIRGRSDTTNVKATIGGISTEVTFAGAQGAFDGLDQVNVRIPRSVGGGDRDVSLTVDGQATNTVSINVSAAASGKATMYLAMMRPEGSASSPASGYSSLQLAADEKSATIKFSYANLTTPETSAHIHGPADPGTNGAILFDLDTAPKQSDGSYLWTFANAGATTVAQIVQALKSGRLYINIHTSKYPSGEIRGHYGLVNGTQAFTPPPDPPALPGGKPTARDAARFLTQATFGPKMSEITDLQNKGFDTWLSEQFAMPVTAHVPYLEAVEAAAGNDFYQIQMMESFWKQAVTGRDQLRQRVSFALGEILVVSFNSNLDNEQYAIASYVDTLNRDAFGNFRQLLEDVTLHPAMGRYLDHLQNDKEDPATGRNPNENYAREVLQLFTIGLYKLHPDGSLMLDGSGLPIPTYDQSVVKGFAHVFTGWSYGWFPLTENNWKWPNTWKNGHAFWVVPMQLWPDHHSTSAKKLLNGVTLPAGQSGQKDLKDALDNIFNHPNVGPFIARQLIQRLVTSNPSPGYVYRVAQKFNNNGSGVRGDMKAVIKAILTDYEARSLDVINNQGYGKLREPVLRLSHLLRAFNYSCSCGVFPLYWMDSPEWAIGQNPLRSPTVFNFFEPNYSHSGSIAAAGLHSPEFQITNDTSVIGISNFMRYVVFEGFKWDETKPLLPDYSAVLPLASNPAQLIDYLNTVMMAGGMSDRLKSSLVTEISRVPASRPEERVKEALHLVITSPEYVIQK
ncbi:MAG TPA: DUF1800 family protein [Blastocatellia bacterium]|nr:DUF1800 family protein [Blastocatellia bacterium]